ncbi:hypothetical protein OG594_02965 [Streptomyces sp. NBC_01214]|uniref:hypothetical protein n=1 Tax=Streptomyces sp. NBC_01214 TaxID=2903777 RepID=UPI0022511CFA|nr:hypothetical protein [Streptomyces sp. NBC_01214]MCX4800638.1 hypothetical protein [Streptomyces sp. NBC_01214]
MSRPRHVWRLLGVVLAVLLGCAAAPTPQTTSPPAPALAPAPAADSTSARTPASAPAPASAVDSAPALAPTSASALASVTASALASVSALAPAAGDAGGPACAPVGPERGGVPAVPARAFGEHAQVPPVRAVPEEAGPAAAVPVRTPVRGPDRPAPDRLELCVMRV